MKFSHRPCEEVFNLEYQELTWVWSVTLVFSLPINTESTGGEKCLVFPILISPQFKDSSSFCLGVSNSFENPWTVAHQAPLSMVFPGQHTGVRPFHSPGETSQTRDGTHMYCIGKWILFHWVTREAHSNSTLPFFSFAISMLHCYC